MESPALAGVPSASLRSRLAGSCWIFASGELNERTLKNDVVRLIQYYRDQGYAGAQNWIDNATRCLKTGSAKRLAKLIAKTRSTEWYEGLKRIKR